MREKKKRCKKRQRFWLTRYGGRVTFFYKGVGSTSSTSPSFYRVRRKHVHRAGRSMITSSQGAVFFSSTVYFLLVLKYDTSPRFYNVRKIFKNFHTFYLGYAADKFKIAEPVKVEKSFYPGEKLLRARRGHLFAPNA